MSIDVLIIIGFVLGIICGILGTIMFAYFVGITAKANEADRKLKETERILRGE